MKSQPDKRHTVRALLALLFGALAVFSFAPYGVWPLMLVSLVGLFTLLQNTTQLKRSLMIGGLYGLGYFIGTIHWIFVSLHNYAGLSALLAALAVLLFASVLAIFPMLATGLACYLAKPSDYKTRRLLLLVILPSSWLLAEWVRGWIFTGFPWASIAYSQIPNGPLAGYMPLFGIYGVGGILAWLAGALVWLGLAIKSKKWRSAGTMLVSVLAICFAGMALLHINWTKPSGAPLETALLQGAIPQNKKWSSEDLQYNLRSYYRLLQQAKGDLIVMPETAFPLFLKNVPVTFLNSVLALANSKNAALIVGMPQNIPNSANQMDYYNSAIVLTAPDMPANSKVHLVPFGEYEPFREQLGWLYRSLDIPLTGFSPAPAHQPPLQIKGQQIAAQLCYEDLFGEELIPAARKATILLNLSNLAWFDGSIALAQHGQIGQARALEFGRTVLRSTNSGTTAIINPKGQYLGKLPEGIQAILQTSAQGYTGDTPYMLWGNLLAVWVALASILLSCGLRWGLRWRARSAP